jgi:hypothetical protein
MILITEGLVRTFQGNSKMRHDYRKFKNERKSEEVMDKEEEEEAKKVVLAWAECITMTIVVLALTGARYSPSQALFSPTHRR